MAQTLMQLQNKTNLPRKVVFEKRIEVIQPFEVRDVDPILGAKFLEEHPHDVLRYTPARIPPPSLGERVVWIANVTGNPFLPETVKDKRVVRGQEEEFTIPNPLRKPMLIREMLRTGQTWEKNPHSGEDMCINHPPTPIEIPPFSRVMCGETIAGWLLNRDGNASKHWRGKIAVADAPSGFEPNESWSFADLQAYARFLDDGVFTTEVLEAPNQDGESGQKAELLKKLFFFVVDPRYKKPSKVDFEAVKDSLMVKKSITLGRKV